jgi:phytoene dehydrogenase-like protein
MTTHSQPDVIVIGAGVSGLIAARTLQATGARVLGLDKGRGVGGRMATRRTDWGVFDHGAQFLTARDPQFRLLAAGGAVVGERASANATASLALQPAAARVSGALLGVA